MRIFSEIFADFSSKVYEFYQISFREKFHNFRSLSFRSLSRQEFVFPEFVFPEFVSAPTQAVSIKVQLIIPKRRTMRIWEKLEKLLQPQTNTFKICKKLQGGGSNYSPLRPPSMNWIKHWVNWKKKFLMTTSVASVFTN